MQKIIESSEQSAGQTRTTIVSVAAATLLVALKLGTGLATGSLGLVSAGIESSGDVVAAVLTLLAVRLAIRPADEGHPYGHRRAENLAALGEAAILTGGGGVVVAEAIHRLTGAGESFSARWYVFVVIGVALVVDASRVLVSFRSAARYRSAALRSNAYHFAGDLAGSLAVLAGLVAVAAGFKEGDVIAALLVALLIFVAAARLIYENARVLMDTAPTEANRRARDAVEALGEGIELRRLRLRESGGRYFADAVVGVPPGQAVVEGHVTADEVEDAVRGALPDSDVVVHLEPRSENLDLRERAQAAALAEPLVREVHDITLYESNGHVNVSLHLKLAPDLPLREAHEAAERVESAIEAVPEVESVQTHLEPLEQTQNAAVRGGEGAQDVQRMRDLVSALTGRGPVAFLTVAVGSDVGLAEAHELAGRLEEEIRRSQPHVTDVVVHTEPVKT
jgi:cation diffusion facilitator family transporter